MKADKIFIPQLTFTRFIAAFIVVAFHYGAEFYPFNLSWLNPLIKNGNVAVGYFFFLSGVVLCVSYWNAEDLSFGAFLKKRMARIYPVYFAAIALTVLIFLIGGSFPPVKYIISQVLMLDAWYPPFCLKLNYPSWSISVELFFYCMFPVCFWFFKKRSFKTLLVTTLFIWLLTHCWDLLFSKELYKYSFDKGEVFTFLNTFPLFQFNTFLFGIMAGVCILKLKQKGKKYSFLPLFVWLIGVFVLCVIVSVKTPFLEGHLTNGILCPLYMMITVGLAMDESSVSKLFSSKPLVYLGNASYAMYLLQFPAMMIFYKIAGLTELDTFYFYLYVLFLLAISLLTYVFYEKKARELILKR